MGIKAPRERDVQRTLLAWLKLHFPLVWRNNSGGRLLPGHGGKGQFVRWGHPGSGDILALAPPCGRLISVECKRPGGKPTPTQTLWMECVRAAGGVAVVASSIEELEAELRKEGLL